MQQGQLEQVFIPISNLLTQFNDRVDIVFVVFVVVMAQL